MGRRNKTKVIRKPRPKSEHILAPPAPDQQHLPVPTAMNAETATPQQSLKRKREAVMDLIPCFGGLLTKFNFVFSFLYELASVLDLAWKSCCFHWKNQTPSTASILTKYKQILKLGKQTSMLSTSSLITLLPFSLPVYRRASTTESEALRFLPKYPSWQQLWELLKSPLEDHW